MAYPSMAKKKPSERSEKNKERVADTNQFKQVGIRSHIKWAEWLEKVARFDRVTIAGFLDRAAADRAKSIGFTEPPPERIP